MVDQLGRPIREDLFARLNLWTYTLPSLAQRREDIEPNIDHQLALASQDLGKQVRFTTEARADYLRFAQSSQAVWNGNFRDLSASITRLATLGEHARIGAALVAAEIARLRWQWEGGSARCPDAAASLSSVMGSAADALDYFDRLQLQAVIAVCRKHHSISDAGRELFDVSRTQRSVVNDADRLRKYLLKFDLKWEKLVAGR
jgi:transcriptional regulatory protein RtcR